MKSKSNDTEEVFWRQNRIFFFLILNNLSAVIALFVIFWGNSILFSTVAAPIYIPNSVRGFPFLQILTNIYYLLTF